MRINEIVLVGSLILTQQLYGECRAEVSGRVIDDTGKPVPQAQVSFHQNRSGIATEAIAFFSSDNNGDFRAEFGVSGNERYSVYAKKENDGYPETRFAFYDNRKPPNILVSCRSSISSVVVEVGPKAAYITNISVLDANDGEAIPKASIRLWRSAAPFPGVPLERFSITTSATLLKIDSGYFGLAIPSNVDILYQISAPGYTASSEEKLHLTPLQKVSISVRLQKSNQQRPPLRPERNK